MKSFQKLFTICAASSIFMLAQLPSNALTLTDVPGGYWAEGSIVEAVQKNYLEPQANKFYPEVPVTRAEFANGVYNVIQRPSVYEDKFKDVSNKTKYGKSILSLHQLQVVFGYPDGNFKPDAQMKRSEASSVIANIIRSDFWDKSILNSFEDKDDIPSWATSSYINNVVNKVYVNHPSSTLLPNEYLTRAEAAVLLVKLSRAIDNYKTTYLPEEVIRAQKEAALALEKQKAMPVYVGTNTLGEFNPSIKNTVNLYNSKKVIEAGNLVPVKAVQKVNSKTVEEGEILTYISPKDIYSVEGTKLYSEGTKFISYVEETQKSYWLKKQNKAYIVFNRAVLTDGTEFPIAGVLYCLYSGKVVPEKKKNSIRVQKDATKKYAQRNAAIKFTNKLVPVIKYNEKTHNNLFMLITGDMIIPETSEL